MIELTRLHSPLNKRSCGEKKEGRDAAFVLLPGQKYQINAAITIANSLLGGLLSRQIGSDVVLVQVFDVIDFFLMKRLKGAD